MRVEELRDIMVRTHMTNNDLTTIIDKSPRQIASYLSGAATIPRAEALLLKAFDAGLVDLDWLLEKVVEEIKEGKETAA